MNSSLNNKMKKSTILQIIPALNSGGVERGTLDIAKALKERGFNTIVVSSGGKMLRQLLELDIRHINLPLDSKNPIIILRNINKIREIIKNFDVDIVHARSRAPAWSAYYAIKGTNAKFITTFHGAYSHNFIKKYYNKIMVMGKRVIAVSNYIQNLIFERYPEVRNKVNVVHRGADLDYFSPENITEQMQKIMLAYLGIEKKKNSKIIVLPARITSWKGQELLIRAAHILISQLKITQKLHIVLIGEFNHQNYKNSLLALINKLGLNKNISIHDSINDMRTLYSIADLVIVPSTRAEAFGRVAIEAQAMKKIVIASNVGGSIETIIDGKTGFLFENNSHIDLADKILHVLSLTEDEIIKMATLARENIEKNFSLAAMQGKTIEIYQELLNE